MITHCKNRILFFFCILMGSLLIELMLPAQVFSTDSDNQCREIECNGSECEKIKCKKEKCQLPSCIECPVSAKEHDSAIVFLIDTSRSMSSGNKLSVIEAAIFQSLEYVKDNNVVSIVGFDDSPFIIWEKCDIVSTRKLLPSSKRFGLLAPSGGTNLKPALVVAANHISKSQYQKKLIIVISDEDLKPLTIKANIQLTYIALVSDKSEKTNRQDQIVVTSQAELVKALAKVLSSPS